MPLRPSTLFARLRRDSRGTTIAEYAIMLFLVIVVCAIGFKFLGSSIQKKFGQADQHMSGQGQAVTASGGGASVGNGARAASGSNSDFGTKSATAEDASTAASNLPVVARMGLVLVGVVGGALVLFAISKSGKKASGASK